MPDPSVTTYRIRHIIKDGEFEYAQFTDLDSIGEPTPEQMAKLVWREYYYGEEEDLDAKLAEAWEQCQRDGFLQLDCDYRIAERIGVDWRETARLEMLPLLKKVYAAMEDGSITDTGSSIPYALHSMIAKAERAV
jgi:hypothetical protein